MPEAKERSDYVINCAWGILLLVYGVLNIAIRDPQAFVGHRLPDIVGTVWNVYVGVVVVAIGLYYLIANVGGALRAVPAPAPAAESAQAAAHVDDLIVITLPLAVSPAQREALYERRLNAFLSADGMGYVSGGGTLLGQAGQADGAASTIDLTVARGHLVLDRIHAFLVAEGYPAGTSVRFCGNTQFPAREMLCAGPAAG